MGFVQLADLKCSVYDPWSAVRRAWRQILRGDTSIASPSNSRPCEGSARPRAPFRRIERPGGRASRSSTSVDPSTGLAEGERRADSNDDCVAMPKAQNLQFSGHGWRLRIKKAPGQRKEEATASSSETKTVLDDRPIESAPKTPESSSVASFIVPEMDSRFLHPRFALIVKLLTVLLVCYSVFLGKSYAAANYVLEDASASKVTSKHTRVPKNILAAVNGNRARAEAKWLRNIEWRRQNGADDILHQPHKYFHQIKKYYPHSIHLKDKDGLYTYWERPGHVDVKGLKKSGINSDILFWHYIWHTEYTWQVVAPKDGAKVTVVQDYGGFTPEKVSLEVLNFVKRAIAMTSEYYPERADKILIVNVPEWYNNIYNILKNFMSEKMRKRIHFFTAKDVQEGKLTRYIPASNLPEEYGGKSKIPLGESKEEKRMKHYVDKVNRKHGVSSVTSRWSMGGKWFSKAKA